MKRRILTLFLVLLVGLSVGYKVGSDEGKRNVVFMLNMLNQVLSYVGKYYVEEVEPPELIEKGIEGMVHSLDPYSDFLTPEEGEEWEVRTKGEFGGLGIQITKTTEKDWITIIAPIEDTPADRAGIRAGDKIIKIEGESTWGMSLREVVKKLRGKPGTKVTITIKRPGLDEPLDFTITRDIIHIRAVPYASLLTPDVGYIDLTTFNRSAGRELREAMDSLFSLGAKKLILDLRSNPGGLLNEAVEVANLFLPRGSLIVSTKGRTPSANQEFRAPLDPPYGVDYPLVVLVDAGSASASEIVSGAIQDWDRGIIIGDTTFGKGSVQRIYRLKKGYELKLTTAKYYTPSGRCIHREKEEEEDTLSNREVFHTRELQRPVYGGGGIVPDITIEPEKLPPLVSKALAKRAFFDFAVEYHTRYPNPPPSKEIQFTEEDLTNFKKMLKEKEISFRDDEFEEAKDLILMYLRLEVVEKYWGRKARYAEALKKDPMVKKALEVLQKANSVHDLFVAIGVEEQNSR
jgi:carboxyl-terminal processing protease